LSGEQDLLKVRLMDATTVERMRPYLVFD
jgi:hypothetical protein